IVGVDETEEDLPTVVYVPSSYEDLSEGTSNPPVPVVFFFHPAGNSGIDRFNNDVIGWRRIAEQEGVIVVYPSARKYQSKDGENYRRWAANLGYNQWIAPNETFRDDLRLVDSILAKLKNTFTIDESRIYAFGFSNGAAFIHSRLLQERSNVFAALGTTGSPIRFPFAIDNPNGSINYIPPLMSVIGNMDKSIQKNSGFPRPYPMDPSEIMDHPVLGRLNIMNALSILRLEENTFAAEVQNKTILSFTSPTDIPLNETVYNDPEYLFIMVEGLDHEYTKREENHINMPKEFWAFFSRFTLPDLNP
ncbi:MAG: hypothetical protein AAFU60_01085, partial [Bacteroidota bacterium]